MCTAVASAPVPLYNEGTKFWQDLAKECQRYVDCINATLSQNGIDADGLLKCAAGPDSLHVIKARLPATIVSLILNFFSWGPVIGITICRQQADGHPFLPQEFEMPIAMDFDDQVVAIYDEGRSFSPHQVASYFAQVFHNCYPSVSFPC
jgi:hypothetical protein